MLILKQANTDVLNTISPEDQQCETLSREILGHYTVLWIAPLILDLYLIMLSIKEASSTIFWVLVWLDLGLNPGFADY